VADIVSVDLGINPASIGLCAITGGEVTIPTLDESSIAALSAFLRHWEDDDGADTYAEQAAMALASHLVSLDPRTIVVDGPQGLARSGRKRRRAEAILRTSGPTGPVLTPAVNGFSWPAIARLGVKLFNILDTRGYPRLTKASVPEGKYALEVFPDSCRHSFGLDEEDLAGLQKLQVGLPLSWSGKTNEHHLDAAAGALTALAARAGHGVFVGHPFFTEDGMARKGYIVIPDPGRDWLRQ